MEILVCVKRVPASGGTPQLTADGRDVDTRHLAFTVGPHEECAIEEAVQLVADLGGSVTVLTVGPAEAEEQLRYALSMGADHGVLVRTGGNELDPQATSAAITEAVRGMEAGGASFDLILFGNESPDAGHCQVGIRVACALGRPMVSGVKGIDVEVQGGDADAGAGDSGIGDGRLKVRRDVPAGVEVYDVPLPAALGVMEGLNLPRYPSMRGRLRARKATLTLVEATLLTGGAPGDGLPTGPQPAVGLRKLGLRLPEEKRSETVLLGHGAAAAPAVVDLLEELELI